MNLLAMSFTVTSLALGTLTTISSFHWMLAWIGLEINTLAMTPMVIKAHHPRSVEASTKYFLTQAAASALMLFSGILNAWLSGEWTINTNIDSTSSTLLAIAILTKLGVPPFHFWLPEVIQGSSLLNGLTLLTWQKLAPMALMIQLHQSINLHLFLALGILSTLIGGWGGTNQTQVRKMFAFSSIAHLGWMISVMKTSPLLSITAFIIYIILTLTLFLTFILIGATTISQLSTTWSKAPAITVLTLLSLLSLGGLPPLTGFLPKWLIAEELIKQDLTVYAFMLLLFSLISLFFYLRLAYIVSLTLAPNSSNSLPSWLFKKPNLLSTPFMLTLCLLLISPMFISFI